MSNTEVMKQSAVKLAGKHPKNKIHRTAGDIAFDVFLYILFVAFTILCVFPFYYLFINTISSNDAVAGAWSTSGRSASTSRTTLPCAMWRTWVRRLS